MNSNIIFVQNSSFNGKICLLIFATPPNNFAPLLSNGIFKMLFWAKLFRMNFVKGAHVSQKKIESERKDLGSIRCMKECIALNNILFFPDTGYILMILKYYFGISIYLMYFRISRIMKISKNIMTLLASPINKVVICRGNFSFMIYVTHSMQAKTHISFLLWSFINNSHIWW